MWYARPAEVFQDAPPNTHQCGRRSTLLSESCRTTLGQCPKLQNSKRHAFDFGWWLLCLARKTE